MSRDPLAFPKDLPTPYFMLDDEPLWDAAIHLVPERETVPEAIETLSDFGYSAAQVTACPGPTAVAGPFRLLSAQGVADAQAVLARLRATAQADTGNRAPNFVAGGTYKSRFLRDMCYCPQLTARIGKMMGCELLPHTMPTQQLYINFAPEDISKAVDSWHVDSIDYDCVILLEDPHSFDGGHFQYFRGTLEQAAQLFDTTVDDLPTGFAQELPRERIVSVQNHHAGDCVAQQGARVVHRAERLLHPAQRTTMVISFVPASVAFDDNNNLARVDQWAMPGAAAELARHCAWRARARLAELIETLPINASADDIAPQLQNAIADVEKLLTVWRAK